VLVVASDWEYLCELEQKAIAAFGTMAPGGFNLTAGGEGAPGQIWTPEQRAKMSIARKGKGTGPRPHARGWSHDAEAKRKISEAGKGREFSEETRAKIGAIHVGNTYNLGSVRSDESRAKMRLAQKGRTFSEETRAKMSAAQKGVKKSPEHAAKVGARHKGKKVVVSPETAKKISEAHRGRKHTEETKQNMRNGWIVRKMKQGEVN